MKTFTIAATLALAGIACSGDAAALGYELRTVPAKPPAGVPFLAAFDGTACELWLILPDAEPPAVTVQGNVVRLEVDRINIVNWAAAGSLDTILS